MRSPQSVQAFARPLGCIVLGECRLWLLKRVSGCYVRSWSVAVSFYFVEIWKQVQGMKAEAVFILTGERKVALAVR